VTFLLPEIDIDSIVIRKNMMAVTILTPKMLSLLDFLQKSCNLDDRTLLRVNELIQSCKDCLSKSIAESSRKSKLPSRIFRRTAQFYSLKDEVILSASIQEKILLWRLSLAESYQEYLYCTSQKFLSITTIREIPKTNILDLSLEQIILELIDYADEIDAWFDIEFADEYDDYHEQSEFDDLVKISASLRILSEQL